MIVPDPCILLVDRMAGPFRDPLPGSVAPFDNLATPPSFRHLPEGVHRVNE